MLPLWQVMQVPGLTIACEKLAGFHAVVRWQASHGWVVAMWPAGLPLAIEALWQLEQLPGVMLE